MLWQAAKLGRCTLQMQEVAGGIECQEAEAARAFAALPLNVPGTNNSKGEAFTAKQYNYAL
jgi:hypothetical protein